MYCLWLPLQLRRPDIVVQYGPGLVNYVDSREGSAMIHSWARCHLITIRVACSMESHGANSTGRH
jgi:hypothetical protein